MKKMFKSFLKENVDDVKKILIKRFVDKDEDDDELKEEINSIYKFECDGFGGYNGVGEDGSVELGYSIVEDKNKIKDFDECWEKIKIKGRVCYMILYNV